MTIYVYFLTKSKIWGGKFPQFSFHMEWHICTHGKLLL